MKLQKDLALFLKGFVEIFTSPFFLGLTALGNGTIGLFGWVFYLMERGSNTHVRSFLDALWWAFATATTTGYGDITPVTVAGKILGVILMLLGLALFAMYTAFFAEIIITIKQQRR